jgi:hypothetical protein
MGLPVGWACRARDVREIKMRHGRGTGGSDQRGGTAPQTALVLQVNLRVADCGSKTVFASIARWRSGKERQEGAVTRTVRVLLLERSPRAKEWDAAQAAPVAWGGPADGPGQESARESAKESAKQSAKETTKETAKESAKRRAKERAKERAPAPGRAGRGSPGRALTRTRGSPGEAVAARTSGSRSAGMLQTK